MTHFLHYSAIIVERESRQRKAIDISDLLPSVRARGIIQPIILGPGNRLLAGERRLRTVEFLVEEEKRTAVERTGLPMAEVPVRYLDELDPIEQQIIELEENTRRTDLVWQDQAVVYKKLHELYQQANANDGWEAKHTAAALHLSVAYLQRMLRIAEALSKGDASIASAPTIGAALTILERRTSRALASAMDELSGEAQNGTPDTSGKSPNPASGREASGGEAGGARSPPGNSGQATGEPLSGGGSAVRAGLSSEPTPEALSPFRVEQGDFLEWAETYAGPRFNFLHVDFPYGVKLGEQANQDSFEGGGYDGGVELYPTLVAGLAKHMQRLVLPSAHLVFWITMKHYSWTVEELENMGWKVNPFPLIWHKTDNAGILPDAKRGPRQIYEAALFASLGDRMIVKPKSNAYGCPTQKATAIHTNEKPQPMLEHFLEMVVDEHTVALDPTCGSGGAIRAIEKLGAKSALGLEINPEFAQRAEAKLRSERGLRKLSKAAEGK